MRADSETTRAANSHRAAPSQVLGVGIATLDLINTVAAYPDEDSEVRALAQRRVRGGNAANTLDLLAQLGHRCTWVGTLADDAAAEAIRADLSARGIDVGHAVQIPGSVTPTSYIALSQATGSRTIVHYRDLPELEPDAFDAVPLDGIDWIHFEGRQPQATARMIERARRDAAHARLSVELEKPRAGSERLLEGPDLLLLSRGFALATGGPGAAADPGAYLTALAARTTASLLVLGWGAGGAWRYRRGEGARHVPAHRPERIVDTLGAGDALNAGVIDGLLRRLESDAAVERAVRLAGIKCGRIGFDGLAGCILLEPGM